MKQTTPDKKPVVVLSYHPVALDWFERVDAAIKRLYPNAEVFGEPDARNVRGLTIKSVSGTAVYANMNNLGRAAPPNSLVSSCAESTSVMQILIDQRPAEFERRTNR